MHTMNISGRRGMHNWAVEYNMAAFSFAVHWQGLVCRG